MYMDFVCQRGAKIDENRGWMSLKSSRMEVWGSLWVAWGVFGETWIRVRRQDEPKMSAVSAKLDQERLGVQLKVFWVDLGTIFARF